MICLTMPENCVFAVAISVVQKNNVDFNVVCWLFSVLINNVLYCQRKGGLWTEGLRMRGYSSAKRLFT